MGVPNPESNSPRIAVLLPCRNEEVTIGKVVKDFHAVLPHAEIYVFDNGSSDRTAQLARDAGAVVVPSPGRGKGNVVRHMFDLVNADFYVLTDGDDTYPAKAAPALLSKLQESNADMVVGTRLKRHDTHAFRGLHESGNRFIAWLVSWLFGASLRDVLSGYRVLTKDLVQSLFLKSHGFEIEAEMTVQALVRARRIVELPIHYKSRPQGSESKLHTLPDGFLILKTIVLIFRDYKPLWFFSTLAACCLLAGILTGIVPLRSFWAGNQVGPLWLVIASAALALLSAVFWGLGLILNAVKRSHFESLEAIGRAGRRGTSSDRNT